MNQSKTPYIIALIALVVGVIGLYTPAIPAPIQKVIERTYEKVGAMPGPEIYQDLTVHGWLTSTEKTTAIAQTGASSTVALAVADSGTTYLLSATGTVMTLPAVTDGINFKFIINGAAANSNFIIDSAEGDNIEGTLIVAGAVVDCAAEDQINFVTDGENIGDYVELISDGSQWLIGDSGVLTSAKMTCTDP